MNDKQAIIDNAKQNGFTYPKARVIFGFVSTGGAVGGFLFGLMLLFGSMIEALTISLNELFAVFFMMVSFAVFFGVFVGAMPALLAGIYLAMREFVIVDVIDYGWLFVIGALMTALSGFVVLGLTGDSFVLMATGGLSAMICGKWFLPKL